jgi:hypothetical protein
VAFAVDLYAEFQGEIAFVGVLHGDVEFADVLDHARAEIGVDLGLPALRLELWDADGDKTVPVGGGFGAAEDEDALAAGGFAVRDGHLDEVVGAECVEGGGFGFWVAADEGGASGGFDAEKIVLVGAVDQDAAVVEVQGQDVDEAGAAEFVGGIDAAQAQDGGGFALLDPAVDIGGGELLRDDGGFGAAAGGADFGGGPAGTGGLERNRWRG